MATIGVTNESEMDACMARTILGRGWRDSPSWVFPSYQPPEKVGKIEPGPASPHVIPQFTKGYLVTIER